MSRLVLACVAALCVALGLTAPALALSQRGHEYGFSFGSEGPGEVSLSHPAGVAVDEASGDVYVVDRANNRIEQFTPDVNLGGKITGYAFASAWGWGVKTAGSKTYEVCKRGEGCQSGTAGKGKGLDGFHLGKEQLVSPTAIAVDNCTNSKGETCSSAEDPSVGDVYVVADQVAEHTYVYKLGPEGEYKQRVTSKEETEESERAVGVAVDAKGEVWVEWSGSFGEFTRFTDEEKSKRVRVRNAEGKLEVEGPVEVKEPEIEPLRAGFALDSQDDLYVTHEEPEAFVEATNEESPYSEEDRGEDGEYPCEQAPCITAKLLGVEIPGNKLGLGGNELQPGELRPGEQPVDGEDTSGIAVDTCTNSKGEPCSSTEVPAAGDVYLDNVTSITALTSSGAVIQSFGDAAAEPGAPEHLSAGSGVVLDSRTGYLFVADANADNVKAFRPEEPAAPTIESISAQDVSPEAAQLDATIDPRGAKELSTWYFEYGAGPCPTACTKVPGGELGGEGFADEGFGEQAVDLRIGAGTGAALSPATTYHYRAVGENAEYGRGISVQGSFSTPPAKGEFIADEREWEMVSPPDKGGTSIEPLTLQGAVTQASQNGQALTYIANGPVGDPEGSRSLEPTQMFATRGPRGWSSNDILTPNEHGNGIEVGVAPEYQYFSPDLSLSLLEPWRTTKGVGGRLAEPPLSPPLVPGEEQEKTIYLRDDQPVPPGPPEAEHYEQAERNGLQQGNPGYLALLTSADVTSGQHFGGIAEFLDATPDLSHVVIRSNVALTSEAQGEVNIENLYEWSDGSLQLISLLPAASPEEGTLATAPGLGTADSENDRNAISADGSRIFWTAERHVYMRDTASRTTVQIDRAQGVPEPLSGGAVYQTASTDGSRVFFTDQQRLTPTAGASEDKPDLYVFEQETGKLTDLSEPYAQHGSESADVQGLVLGVSEDGAYVYFVANGVLSSQAQAAGASTGRCVYLQREEGEAPGTTCNLYVEHYQGEPGAGKWEEPLFIATLSNEDEPDWAGGVYEQGLGEVTARVSRDGRHLAFMSDRSLTSFEGQPYDNDATAEGANDAPAEEVYEYTLSAGAPGGTSLACVSCDSSGGRPVGVYDPVAGSEGAEGLGLLVDRPRIWAGRWLAGSVPGWTKLDEKYVTHYQSRYLSDSGRLFFDSPEALVPQDKNGREDVYEYEPQEVPQGRHECASANATFSTSSGGCVGLISSGTSEHESAFLDASEAGGEGEHGEVLHEGGSDVFFVTAAPLSSQDVDHSFDVYDAHECSSASPCIVPPEEELSTACESSDACHPYVPTPAAAFGPSPSASSGPSGNLSPKQSVLSTKATIKPLSRAQRLGKAMKRCRAKDRHSRRRRVACERRARLHYGNRATKGAHGSSARQGRAR